MPAGRVLLLLLEWLKVLVFSLSVCPFYFCFFTKFSIAEKFEMQVCPPPEFFQQEDTLPKFNIAPEKKMVGRLLSFWNGTFSGASCSTSRV